jgi:hypothetical protein
MAIPKVDIRDWARGTTPPITIRMKDETTGLPMSLEGCRIAFVVRTEAWEDSFDDTTAVIALYRSFWRYQTVGEAQDMLNEENIGDYVWIDETGTCGEVIRGDDGVSIIIGEGNTTENQLVDGLTTIRLNRQQTLIPVDTYYYSIDIRFDNGEVAKISRGKLQITSNTVSGGL